VSVPRCVVLIPSYNTGPILCETLERALAHAQGIPLWVVIDGSTDDSARALAPLVERHRPALRLLILPQNRGKGAAILHGLHLAVEEGFTHVLTMDADGQHSPEFIPTFCQEAASHPEAAVFGRPVFDASAPALRVNGRKISNFWANLETLGWGIDDSLFGMRLYPAAPLREVLASTRFARRFDFDPEVAVRLAWRGVPIVNLPTPVRYPPAEDGGVSQFRYFRDNALLTWMHIRLMLGFLLRLPVLLARGPNPLLHLSPPQS
jgi:glycosyltransferase involved in cell wall biosynthesis